MRYERQVLAAKRYLNTDMLSDWNIKCIYILPFLALLLLTQTSPHRIMGVLRKMGKSPPMDPSNVCISPGGHILRNHPNSSIAALICFTPWGQALQAAEGGAPLPMKRKEIADINYNFAILNILPLIWSVLTLVHVLNREGLKFTMVSSKKYFLGFEEETWLHKNCIGSVPAQDASLLIP